jgi:hypothetical protein
MATNPMKRKTQNSFLLGMLLTLVITGAIIAFLVMQLLNMKQEQEQSTISVYVLKNGIEAGAEFNLSECVTTQVVDSSVVPSNRLTIDEYKELTATTDQTCYAKIELEKGTILTSDMIAESETELQDDVRKQEYNMLTLPMDLVTGDFIDVRLRLPSGVDCIVVSKKKVEIPEVDGMDSLDTIWLELSEDEIVTMSNAIVEAYYIDGSELYVTKYTEPGLQAAAEVTYVVSQEVVTLINSNPNITKEAREALATRIEKYGSNVRNNLLNSELTENADSGDANVKSKVETEITNSKANRKSYLESVSAGN